MASTPSATWPRSFPSSPEGSSKETSTSCCLGTSADLGPRLRRRGRLPGFLAPAARDRPRLVRRPKPTPERAEEPHAEPLPLPGAFRELGQPHEARVSTRPVVCSVWLSMWFSGQRSSTRSWSSWTAPRFATASKPARPPLDGLEASPSVALRRGEESGGVDPQGEGPVRPDSSSLPRIYGGSAGRS